MNTVTVTRLDESNPAALFHHYQFQTDAQDVYLELDTEDGEFSIDYNGEIGNSIPPASVFHNRTLRWGLGVIPTTTAANTILTELAPLAQRILDGATVEWDGSNHIGYLTTDDAAVAAEEIATYCDGRGAADLDLVEEYDAGYWFSEGLGDIVITADTTDEEIAAVARQQEHDAQDTQPGRYYVLTGTEEYLLDLRNQRRYE